MERVYVAIDLKSFYASVECVERGLDALNTNLVVADESRTEKTICLAVSPSLKAYGISGRARLFEVVQRVREVNRDRMAKAYMHRFSGESYFDSELSENCNLKLSYIIASPRMALYSKYSTKIYQIYLNYVSEEDIHVYSIDEVFMDVTHYLGSRKMTVHEFAKMIIDDVLRQTGITATVGIGTNLYLSKIAMDIMAKKMPPDRNGARIAYLDEMTYRRELWNHKPLTDFWRIGSGYAKKLESCGIYTMGDIAECSSYQAGEDLLYKMFGVNAELLIDHAWGWEPCTIADIKSYKTTDNSISSGQVLKEPYTFENAEIIVKEMAELLALDLVEKKVVTNQIVLTVGYDVVNITGGMYNGNVTEDRYGRTIPKHAHGSANIENYTSSTEVIVNAFTELYNKITDKKLLIRRITVVANHVVSESDIPSAAKYKQLDMFSEPADDTEASAREKKEKMMQYAMLDIKRKFGKNAVLKGMNLKDGATTIERNGQIGGHKS